MPLLVNPFKRARREEEDRAIDPPIAEDKIVEPSLTTHRLVLLRLATGSMSYRLHLFSNIEGAAAFTRENLWPTSQPGAVIAFWALHCRPETPASSDPAEAVVIIHDPQHPEVIQLYSFVDMESAQGFVRDEFRNGIGLGLVFVFWALSVDLSSATQAEAPEASGAPERTYFAMPTLTRTASAVPAELRQQAAAPPATPASVKESPKAPEEEPGTEDPTEDEPSSLSGLQKRVAVVMDQIKTWPGWIGLAPRMVDAAILKEETYEDAYKDPHALGRARLIISLAILASGISASRGGIDSFALYTIAAAFGWAAYAGVIYMLGSLGFGGRGGSRTFQQLVQTLGLAATPALLLVFGAIPTYGPIPVLVAYFWLFITTVHATYPPMNIDRQSAIVTAAVGCLTLFAVSRVGPILLS